MDNSCYGSLAANTVYDVYADRSGKIYAATNRGLSISTDSGASFNNKTTADGLATNYLCGVYADGVYDRDSRKRVIFM